MKAGIITHYDVHNHGAHLQLYALSKQLERLGYEAKALRYKKNYDFMELGIGAKYELSLKSIPVYLKYLMSNGVSRTLYNYRKRKVLGQFRRTEALVGDYYSHARDLDTVVIGSDEIFSMEAGMNPWFWGMGIPCDRIISYAASFGPTTLDFIKGHYAETFVEAGIKTIDQISVRDKNSMELVKHYSGREVPIVCDPVLLYDFPEQLNESAIGEFRKAQKKKYCIVYSYDYNMNDDETVRKIREYAKKRDLKVYSVAYFHKWCDKNIQVSPLEVFQWFACAEMVFTDTFHGSVISLVTGAQFISKIRGNGNKLTYLLQQFGVENRIVESFGDINAVIADPIDYSVVSERIGFLRKESLNYLRQATQIEGR